jgi:hypothetical protein
LIGKKQTVETLAHPKGAASPMTTDARPDRVFLSYSSKDKRWADAACAMLESKGVRCWVAPRDIAPGTEWGASIISGMDACRVMVLIFSDNANQSPQVRREVERAVSKGMVIVPCRAEDVQPAGALEYALSNTHWLDIFTPPVEGQLQQLVEAVQAVLTSQHPATSSQNRPGQKTTATVPPVARPAKTKGSPIPLLLVLGIVGVVVAVFVFWEMNAKAKSQRIYEEIVRKNEENKAKAAREFEEKKAKAARARLVLSCEEKLVIKIKKDGAEVPPMTIKIERIECRGEVLLFVRGNDNRFARDWESGFFVQVPDGQNVVELKLPDIRPFDTPSIGIYVIRVYGRLSQDPYPDAEGGVDIRVEVTRAP